MEHVYANHSEAHRDHNSRRRYSIGGNGQFYYQNQDFFSTTINESSGGEDPNQNREEHISRESFRAFPNFNYIQHAQPTEPEFSSHSSREWDQDPSMLPNVLRKVSKTVQFCQHY